MLYLYPVGGGVLVEMRAAVDAHLQGYTAGGEAEAEDEQEAEVGILVSAAYLRRLRR